MSGTLAVLASLDWSPIVAALIVTIPGVWAAVVGTLNRRQIKTPSGDTIGHLAERTHDLSAANVALSTRAVKILNGKDEHAAADA